MRKIGEHLTQHIAGLNIFFQKFHFALIDMDVIKPRAELANATCRIQSLYFFGYI